MTYRKNWGEERVYFYDSEGRLMALPAAWTDVFSPDPFVAISAGRSALRICWNSFGSSTASTRREKHDEYRAAAAAVSGELCRECKNNYAARAKSGPVDERPDSRPMFRLRQEVTAKESHPSELFRHN